MKKYTQKQHLLLLCGFLICFFPACKKVLDEKPTTEYTTENFWNEQSQAEAALNGAYYLLQGAMNQEFVYYGEGRADNLQLSLQVNNAAIGVIRNTLDGNLSYANWGNYYQVIKQANLIIKNVKAMKERGVLFSASDYNKILGQAHGLRAYCYFYMSRIWGNLPLLTEPAVGTTDINSYKTPRVDTLLIYKQISSDLTLAQSLLPATNSSEQQTRAQLTKGGIDAILTDYYMWRNNIDSALITSQRVLGSSTYRLTALYDPAVDYFANIALIDNAEYSKMFVEGFSAESIFEIDYNFTENTTSGLYGLYGLGSISTFISSNALNAKFDLNDLRLLTDFRNDNHIFKFFQKTGFDVTTDNDKNVILYRLADIMLLRAEALNAKGRVADAFSLVNQIRARAGVAAVTSAQYNAFSRIQAEDYILDERARELCFEGKRWFDLVRTGRVFTVMQPINGLKDKSNLLWPISLDVIRQNPLIEQNIFYK